jgi:hypothetical protein
MRIAWLSIGDPHHAICALSLSVARSADCGIAVHVADVARLLDEVRGLPPVELVHLHTNDWLLRRVSPDPAAVVEELSALLATRGAVLSLTLHDLPQRSGDLFSERAATYRRMIAAAALVVVSSRHEQQLVAELGAAQVPVVIPLPVDAQPFHRSAGNPAVVGILGYLYPGKGHRGVIHELAGSGLTIRALGRPSDGQEYLVAELTAQARCRGVDLEVTGWIPEAELSTRLREVGVPVAPHTEVSASGSINSWIAAGRRPLVAAGRYAAELAERMPGAIRLYEPGTLLDEIRCATTDPGSTWLDPSEVLGPTTGQVAAAYRQLLTERR